MKRSGEYWNPTAGTPCTSALQGVLVGRTLVDLYQPTAVVRLMNLTGQRCKVRKGTEIANCEPVESVKVSHNTEKKKCANLTQKVCQK